METPYKSGNITWTSGGSETEAKFSWLPRTGPRGGRNIVVRVEVDASLNYTTDASTTMAGADFASSIKKLRIFDRKGPRRYLSGFLTRIKAFMDLKGQTPADPSNLAISQTNQLRQFLHVVSFRQPFAAHDEDDFLMPVDHLHDGGGITIEMPANSDLLATGGTPSIVSGTYQITAWCREDFDYQEYMRDVVIDEPQKIDTSLDVNVNNMLIAELTIQKSAASGGASVSGIDTVTIEPFGIISVKATRITSEYNRNFTLQSTVDPVFNGKVLPVVFRSKGCKWAEMKRAERALNIQLPASTLTSPNVMVHLVYKQDDDVNMPARDANKVPRGARATAKTVRGTRRNLESWGGLGEFIRRKVAVAVAR